MFIGSLHFAGTFLAWFDRNRLEATKDGTKVQWTAFAVCRQRYVLVTIGKNAKMSVEDSIFYFEKPVYLVYMCILFSLYQVSVSSSLFKRLCLSTSIMNEVLTKFL